MRSLGRSPIVSPAPAPAVAAAIASAPPAIRRGGPRFGVFEDVKEACAAAQEYFQNQTVSFNAVRKFLEEM